MLGNTGYDCLVENDLVVISTAEKIRMIQFSRTHKFTDIPTEKLNIMCKNVRFVLAPDLDGDSPNGSLKFDKKTGIIAVTTDSKTHELVERLFALMALYEREALKQKKRQITM